MVPFVVCSRQRSYTHKREQDKMAEVVCIFLGGLLMSGPAFRFRVGC